MTTPDYVNPQANVIEDDDVKKFIKGDTSTPKFNSQTAEPLKTIPQLSTNRSARYQRPLTDEERGQATADYFTGKPSAMTSENRAVNSPEVSTGISALLGGGTEAFGNFVPYAVAAMRGIESNKEHPATTGDPFKDMMNSLHDNAMRGIFEPETTEPTSVHILNNPDLFGKTNPQTAAAVGTLAEFSAAMITNPLSILPEGFQALSRENQNRLLFNKITQSSHWGDNITAMAAKAGTTWDKILPQAQRGLWDAINKGNYMQVIMKNIDLYQPFQLKGLTTEDVSLPIEPDETTLTPTVKAGDKTETGVDHEEALNKIGMSKNTHEEGKDFQAGFTNSKGEFITREQSKLPPYNLPTGHSEDIPEDKRKDAVQSETVAPYEVTPPIAPKKLITMRQNYLESQSDNIDSQMRILESEKKKREDLGLSTYSIDAKLDKLGKRWLNNESFIAENIIGKVKINEIQNEIGQVKINKVIKDVNDAEEKGVSEGMRKGITIGKEKGRMEEAQRKSALITYAKYKSNAVQEMNKIASTLQRIKDSTEGLPLEYKEQLDEMLGKFDLAKRTNQTLANREKTVKFIEREKAKGNKIPVPDDIIKMAYSTPLNDLTVNQLRDINNLIGMIYRMGKLENKLIEAKGLRDLNAVVKEAVNNITRGEGLTPETSLIKEMKKRDRGIAKQIASGKWADVKSFMISNMLPELIINALDGWEHTGIATKTLFDPMHEATNTEMENLDKAWKTTSEIFVHRDPKGWQELVKVGNLKLKRSEMMFIYANAANDANRKDLLEYGVTDEDINNVEKAMSDEDKMAVRKLWNYFDKEQFPRLFAERYSLEGVSTKKEDNYFPIANLDNMSSAENLDWERMYRDSLRKAGVDKGMLKERSRGAMAFKRMDFFGTIGRSIERAEHYLAFARNIRNANKFLNHPDVKDAINQKFGDHYYNVLQKWVKDVARGKLDYDTGWPASIARFGRLHLAPAVLGINFLTAEKQFVGLLNGMEMAGKSATLSILPKMAKNYIKASKDIASESSMMNFRGMRQEREFEEMRSARGFFEKGGNLTFYHKFTQAMMFFTQQADLAISRAVYLGTKEALKSRGVTDKKQLISEAERTVRRTQPMGGLMYLPDIFRGGELEKQFTFLKGHRNKFFNLQLEMMSKKMNGNLSNARFVSGILFHNLLPIIMLGAIEHKQLSKTADWAEAEGSQLFSGVALVQDVFDSLREGKRTFSIPIVEYLEMAGKIFSSKKPDTKIKRAAEFDATSAGLPVIGAERIAKGEPFGESKENKYKKDFMSAGL